MKNLTLSLVILSVALVLPTTAGAKTSSKRKQVSTSDTPELMAAQTSSPQSTAATPLTVQRIGAGLTSLSVGGTPAALSAWIDLSDKLSAQGVFGIGGTDPFTFGVGGFGRYTLTGDLQQGLHAGAGLQLGTFAGASNRLLEGPSSKFYIDLMPIAGFHFLLPNSRNIGLSLDAGMIFSIRDGNFSFATSGLSSLLGLSVHYFL